jgi:hypothetical protein
MNAFPETCEVRPFGDDWIQSDWRLVADGRESHPVGAWIVTHIWNGTREIADTPDAADETDTTYDFFDGCVIG